VMNTYICLCLFVCVCVHICVCVYIYIYIYIYIHVYMYVNTSVLPSMPSICIYMHACMHLIFMHFQKIMGRGGGFHVISAAND
jgi:hypothetical protein